MSGFTAVDLSQLPAPSLIESLSYETILQAMIDDLIARDPTLADVINLESEPARKILEVCALRELLVRQRVNEAGKAVMLAYAQGADLDQIGANYNVERLVIDAGDPDALPPVDPTYENDTDFRRRIQLSFEGHSTAGPAGAYVYHALSADPDVLDANASSPSPGDVTITILSRTDDGTAPQALIDTVTATLSADDVRPLTDNVTVQSATITTYSVDATLYFYTGPDRAVVMQQAQAALDAYTVGQHKLGLDVTLSGLYAALHQPGVQRVELASPAANIPVNSQTAAYCTGTNLIDGGTDE